ncbi:MAG TPA: hypothetical protein VK184_03050 [Nostocaceae cyanobacterium]|nr:hypothetical protein [Nostocaceae cyanobacterium]
MVKYSDAEINNLINEPKPLPLGWQSRIQFREVRLSKQGDFSVQGNNGNQFQVVLRQNLLNELDFAIILGIYPSGSNKLFRLKRYDGKVQEHTNPIEKERFYNFHIHTATERYQNYGNGEEDKYAQQTDRFTNYGEALYCMIKDCAFILPNHPQLELFS